jgi:hypothetical protein
MADQTVSGIRSLAVRPGVPGRLRTGPSIRGREPSTAPIPPPASPTPATPPVAPRPSLPAAPVTSPFASLPFRSPGDRIKAEDFNALAKGLQIIGDVYVLAGALFGVPFGQAKLHLASQQYEIERVMTVFGTEVSAQVDASLDSRKLIQIFPSVLGERRVIIVVTEAVETRRLAPNLLGMTYGDARERQLAVFGEGTFPTTTMAAPPLVGRSLREAQKIVNQ